MRAIAISGACWLALLVWWPGGTAVAQDAAAGAPGLTIYTENLGVVRRSIPGRLEPGTHTVRVDGLPRGLEVSSLVIANPEVTLLSLQNLRTYDGGGGSGASVDLELEVRTAVDRLEIAYVTPGLDWSAAYNMVVDAGDERARFDGYAMLSNGSGVMYQDARVQLLAGTIWRGGAAGPVRRELGARAALEAAVAADVSPDAFADYHLYTLPDPLTIRAGESRRLRLLGDDRVRTRKRYTFTDEVNYYQPGWEARPRPALVSYLLPRSDRTGFGAVPLPAGPVHVYQPDEAGRLQLLGIAALPNTPAAEDLVLHTGYAFDLRGTRTQLEHRRVNGNTFEAAWRVELRNEMERPATVRVIERMGGDWEILESTHEPLEISAAAVRFDVEVPARGAAVLEYRMRVRT